MAYPLCGNMRTAAYRLELGVVTCLFGSGDSRPQQILSFLDSELPDWNCFLPPNDDFVARF